MQQETSKCSKCIYDHVNVLMISTNLPRNLPDTERSFYENLAEEFEHAVNNRLKAQAIEAYRCCSDRRKRWRYKPWNANFSLFCSDENTFVLTVSTNGTTHINERHTWANGLIVKREKI